jgi:hypothetical protein
MTVNYDPFFVLAAAGDELSTSLPNSEDSRANLGEYLIIHPAA